MQNNQIDEVKSKTDIVSLLSEYIELKKAGRNYKANCPFHGEKTPSFMVSPELQMYKCFGCGRSGDVYSFIEEHEGMTFGEALKFLAEKANIKLVSSNNDDYSERDQIIKINESSLNFYKYVLHSHPAGKRIIEYLVKNRELREDTINEFNIGYSPDNYDSLYKYLTIKKKYKREDLIKAGLIAGRTMDRFKGRVVFPLFDHRDKVVGFSGRILPWMKQDMAKYINSPDTPAYHKSKMLYGLNITKQFIRDKKFAIVVEGELDMISSYQVGINNVVAIKGSALTEDHLRLIGRFCQSIVLCLDSDFAGDEAAKRGAILAVNMGFEVKVAQLINYKDPDDAAKGNPEELKKSIDTAIGIWDFLIDQIFEKFDESTGNGKALISKELKVLLGLIKDKIVQSYYVELAARRLSVPVEAVMSELSDNITLEKEIDNNKITAEKVEKSRRRLLEEKLIVNIFSSEDSQIDDKNLIELISVPVLNKIVLEYVRYRKNTKKFDIKDFGNYLPKELQNVFSEIILENSDNEDVDVLVREITKIDLKDKREELSLRIKKDNDNDELLKEFDMLNKKLSTL